MPNNLNVNDIVQQATGLDFEEASQRVSGNDGLANEYLAKIKNVLGRIVIGNYLSSEVPFIKYFWKEGMKYGDYELIRQTMLARYGEYDEIFDGNDHYNSEVKEQTIWSVFKDIYTLSLSVDIIAAAFNSPQSMGTFISQYMLGLKHSMNFKWLERFIKMFQSTPTIYKIQNEVKEGSGQKLTGELMDIINKMKMTTNQFNTEGVPQMTNPKDLIIILNSKLSKYIQIEAVAGLLNFSDMNDSGVLKKIYTYDFSDPEVLGWIGTETSFWLDERFEKATSQSFASTLITDNFHNQWIRAGRIGFANQVMLVSKDSRFVNGEKMDYTLSPFTHYVGSGKDRVIIKDEPIIRDLTTYVKEGKVELIKVPTNLKTHIKNGVTVKAAANIPTEIEIKAALKAADFRLETDLIQIVNVTENRLTIKALGNYVVNSFTDTIEVSYVLDSGEGAITNPVKSWSLTKLYANKAKSINFSLTNEEKEQLTKLKNDNLSLQKQLSDVLKMVEDIKGQK